MVADHTEKVKSEKNRRFSDGFATDLQNSFLVDGFSVRFNMGGIGIGVADDDNWQGDSLRRPAPAPAPAPGAVQNRGILLKKNYLKRDTHVVG